MRRILVVSTIAAAILLTTMPLSARGSVSAPQASDGPIMSMTPAQLFSNPRLKQLAVAAQLGDVKKIDSLVAAGVNVNGKGKYGITPLFSALQIGSKAGFKALLDHGANPNNVWTDGHTLMNWIACCVSNPYFMEAALKHGGDPNLVAPYGGKTPLLAAITASGNVNVPLLIKAGADLNYQMPPGKMSHSFMIGNATAMMEAALLGNFKIVYELLSAGANYDLKDDQGKDVRDYIIFSGGNAPKEEISWRNRVISFLKQHEFWVRIAPPTNFRPDTFSVPDGGSYVLSWDIVFNAKTYELSLNGKISRTSITGNTVKMRASSREANSSGNLGWRVRACDDQGCSKWSPDIAVAVTEKEAGNSWASPSVTPTPSFYATGKNSGDITDLRCISADKLTNKLTPVGLDFALLKCVKENEYENAILISALAGVYAKFDTLRVADKTAHGVNSEMLNVISNGIPKEKSKRLYRKLLKTENDPQRLGALCERVERIGPPDYYPAYMVQHGMQAFTGFKTPGGLVPGFDARKAWIESLTSYLHCPNAGKTIVTTPKLPGTDTLLARGWATGSFASSYDVACVGAEKLEVGYSPADLYPAIEKCLKGSQYDKAAFMLVMAAVYADFDTRRVADTTAHNAGNAMIEKMEKQLTKDKAKKLAVSFVSIIKTPNKLAAACTRLERLGPPDYYPRYMVEFGAQAFTGFKSPKDLVPNFDARKAWMETLTGFLRCSNVNKGAELSKGGKR